MKTTDARAVTLADTRPAGPPGVCFYCRASVGQAHAAGCVCVQRRVIVRMTVEYPVDVPADWDAAMIEFHRNEASWCANNALAELAALYDREDDPPRMVGGDYCLCGHARFEYVREADAGAPEATAP